MNVLSTTLISAVFLAMVTNIHAGELDHTKDTLKTVMQNVADERAVLVDVREKNEWDQGHIRGSIFFPSSSLRDLDAAKAGKKLPKDKILYTFCVAGIRSLAVGEALRGLGYEVRPLEPGYRLLVEAGFEKAPDDK